ncbi:MAG TPA: GNAT family N-acetyltransferase [Acidimicrobiales bacterium]
MTVEVRRFRDEDQLAVVALLATSLGWEERADNRHSEFFSWKHRENPFGPSVGWVAVDGPEIVAFRTFMRWEFLRGRELVRAVRAVDTATHPDYQGQGLFTRLTKIGIGELRNQGVSFVFNTPNDKSRPGYLKMGWQVVGRLPVDVRLRSLSSLRRVLTSRVPAEKWSDDLRAGAPAADVLADTPTVEALLGTTSPPVGLSTRRSPAFLSWRYGFAPLGYSVLRAGASTVDGIAIFRLRRRGDCVEATICDLLVSKENPSVKAQLVRQLLRASGADYALKAGGKGIREAGMVRAPRQGPVLTWRALANDDQPPLSEWQLALGDIELF